MLLTDADEIVERAKNAQTVAVVGISRNPERASYQIADQIRDRYTLLLVNPKYAGETILGTMVYSSLHEIKMHVDIVDVFRNPQFIEPIIKDAIAIGAGAVWLQPGSENMEIVEKYKDKIDIIYQSCLGVVSRMI